MKIENLTTKNILHWKLMDYLISHSHSKNIRTREILGFHPALSLRCFIDFLKQAKFFSNSATKFLGLASLHFAFRSAASIAKIRSFKQSSASCESRLGINFSATSQGLMLISSNKRLISRNKGCESMTK